METRGENGFEPLGLKYFPRRGGFAPENLVLRQMFRWYDQPMVGSTDGCMINRWYDQPMV